MQIPEITCLFVSFILFRLFFNWSWELFIIETLNDMKLRQQFGERVYGSITLTIIVKSNGVSSPRTIPHIIKTDVICTLL